MNMKNTLLFLGVVIAFLFVIKTFDIGYPLHVSLSSANTELAVVGEGRVDAVPDTAYVDVGVTVNNSLTAEEAKNKIDKINSKIAEVVKTLGISQKEIKTTNYSVYPTYSYDNNTSKIIGYDGNATLTIKTKQTELVSQIIEAATKAGANQINNTRFVVDDPALYREAARDKAIKNAKEQAQKLAKSLGIKLGRVVNVVESLNNGSSPLPLMSAKFDSMGGGEGTTLEAGAETITSTVTLYFEKR